ncbi:hypothetical protein [Streptomyces sp. CB00316]|uniref:hypothetical protein n=1 Tax=Streptomyces sp. CB00316 TaxID=1703932 RepID=UPI0011612FA9|nr:hypothetical protein [Streptomyces sp. CB00316]
MRSAVDQNQNAALAEINSGQRSGHSSAIGGERDVHRRRGCGDSGLPAYRKGLRIAHRTVDPHSAARKDERRGVGVGEHGHRDLDRASRIRLDKELPYIFDACSHSRPTLYSRYKGKTEALRPPPLRDGLAHPLREA